MPRTPINYENTIMYKLVCKDINITECYVGHTTDFTKRKYQHKSDCNNKNTENYNSYVYIFIRENGGWKNWDMIEIEKFKCNDVLKAKQQERFWIETLKSKLNSIMPFREMQEKIEQQKMYRKNNKEKRILEYEEFLRYKENYNMKKEDFISTIY
jgi:predicted GIY-YIG superfamily endonuclease